MKPFCDHATGGGPTLSRTQLAQQVARFASTLRASGIRPGDTVSLADTNTVGGLVLWLQSLPANLLLAASACTRGADAARPLVRQRHKLTAVRVTSCSGGVCDRLLGHHMGAHGGGAAELQLQGGAALTAATAVFSLQGEHPDPEHGHSHVCIAAP